MQEDESRVSQGFGSEGAADDANGSNAHDLKDELGKKAHQVADRARSAADRGKQKLTEGAEDVTGALRHASEGLRADDQDELARYTGLVADKLEQFTGTIKNRDIRGLVSDVTRFAKQQPALFLGGAFTTGLIAARFLKSSAAKDDASSPRPFGDSSGGQRGPGGPGVGEASRDDAALRDEVAAPGGFGPAPGGYGPAASPAGAYGGAGIFGAEGAGGGPGNDANLPEARKGAAE